MDYFIVEQTFIAEDGTTYRTGQRLHISAYLALSPSDRRKVRRQAEEASSSYTPPQDPNPSYGWTSDSSPVNDSTTYDPPTDSSSTSFGGGDGGGGGAGGDW